MMKLVESVVNMMKVNMLKEFKVFISLMSERAKDLMKCSITKFKFLVPAQSHLLQKKLDLIHNCQS